MMTMMMMMEMMRIDVSSDDYNAKYLKEVVIYCSSLIFSCDSNYLLFEKIIFHIFSL